MYIAIPRRARRATTKRLENMASKKMQDILIFGASLADVRAPGERRSHNAGGCNCNLFTHHATIKGMWVCRIELLNEE
jgi:hypothetical protein